MENFARPLRVMPGHSRPKDGVATLAYDPGIHDEAQHASPYVSQSLMHRLVDCRVKPGNDEREGVSLTKRTREIATQLG
jgi:hypothetical protein